VKETFHTGKRKVKTGDEYDELIKRGIQRQEELSDPLNRNRTDYKRSGASRQSAALVGNGVVFMSPMPLNGQA